VDAERVLEGASLFEDVFAAAVELLATLILRYIKFFL